MQDNFESSLFNLARLFNSIKLNLFRIILIFFTVLCYGLYFYSSVDRVYAVKSLMQVQSSTSSNSLEDILMSDSNKPVNITEEMAIYLSNSNVKKVIENLSLNLIINENNYQFNKNEMIGINYFSFKKDLVFTTNMSMSDSFLASPGDDSYSFYVTKVENGFKIDDNDDLYEFNQLASNEVFSIRINHLNGLTENEKLKITYVKDI